mmetsp:Transcript_44616/g.127998  ORF Transcript_44616/g.127998 Transcript_44616/m.127998 type:complete len:209 (+) Transcript_44616:176-802(+)
MSPALLLFQPFSWELGSILAFNFPPTIESSTMRSPPGFLSPGRLKAYQPRFMRLNVRPQLPRSRNVRSAMSMSSCCGSLRAAAELRPLAETRSAAAAAPVAPSAPREAAPKELPREERPEASGGGSGSANLAEGGSFGAPALTSLTDKLRRIAPIEVGRALPLACALPAAACARFVALAGGVNRSAASACSRHSRSCRSSSLKRIASS